MDRREIIFSSPAEELAVHPAVENLVGCIEKDYEYIPVALMPDEFGYEQEGVFDEFLTSDSFKVLSDADKASAVRAVNIALRSDDKGFWLIEGEPSQDNLLGLPLTEDSIPAIAGDSVISTGVVLLDVDRVQSDFWDRYPELFESRVEFANFIGAVIIARKERDTHQNTLSYSVGPFANERIVIGGDFHGDFRMRQFITYHRGSINPAGNPVPYAPIARQRAVAGYHSVEPILLADVLKHLHSSGMSDTKQKETIKNAIMNFIDASDREQDIPAGGNFADYGSSETVRYHSDEMVRFLTEADYRQIAIKRGTWSDTRISPAGRSRLRTKTVEDALLFVNTYEEDGETKEATRSAISLPTAQIGAFITALLHQTDYAMGRSSPDNLLTVLNKRLSTTPV